MKAIGARSLIAVAVSLFLSAPAVAEVTTALELPAGDLVTALRALAKQSDVELLYQPDQLRTLKTTGLKGNYSAQEAVSILIRGMPLRVYATARGVMVIAPMDQKTSWTEKHPGSLRLTQAAGNQNVAASAKGADDNEVIQEVIVTARKREERLLSVPVPVSVVNTQTLSNNNQLRLQDYYYTIPGFNVAPSPTSGGGQMLTVRGVTTGFGSPTVGITIDDVPFGSGGSVVPDLDPADLASIELLRGPQGTLYGASSMGGLLKYVTRKPSIEGVAGQVQVGASKVSRSDDVGYNARGSVNLPFGESVAVRASGFARLDPGYIDNPLRGIEDLNETTVSGGHLAALWEISPIWSLSLGAIYQETNGDGSNDINRATNGYDGPALGEFQQNYLPGVGAFERKVEAYSATLSGEIGQAEITSLTGYNVNDWADSLDYSYVLGGAPTALQSAMRTTTLTQELRLSIPIGTRAEWRVGGFFSRERRSTGQTIARANADGQILGALISISATTRTNEYALFSDLTYHFTERFAVQVGARQSRIELGASPLLSIGPLVPVFYGAPSPYYGPGGEDTNDAFTYLFSPQFQITDDVLLYGQVSSGYRNGSVNSIPNVPRSSDPDMTDNYELGMKGRFLDNRLTVDTSVYYIDWKDIQVSLQDPLTNVAYRGNGSAAKSEGVELSMELRPIPSLSITAWGVWNEAVLTEALPPATAYGQDGDRLPFSAERSGTLSVDKRFELTDELSAFAGASVSYVGERRGLFGTTPGSQREVYPEYTTASVHAGVKYRTWTLNAFANNLTDEVAVLGGGLGGFPPFAYSYLHPRTVGMSLSTSF